MFMCTSQPVLLVEYLQETVLKHTREKCIHYYHYQSVYIFNSILRLRQLVLI